MNIEIDTHAKSIKVKGTVNLKELFNWLNNAFPDFEWMNYQITEHHLGQNIWVNPQPYIDPNQWVGPGITSIPYIGDPNILTGTGGSWSGASSDGILYSGNSCACPEDHFKVR